MIEIEEKYAFCITLFYYFIYPTDIAPENQIMTFVRKHCSGPLLVAMFDLKFQAIISLNS